MSNHVRHRVSLRQLIALDLATFLTVLTGVTLAVSLLSLLVLVSWMGGPPPRESPAEILLGCGAVIGGGLAFVLHRLRRVTAILNQGNMVETKVLRGLHFQFFVQLLVQFPAARGITQRKLWLPNTRGPRSLTARDSIIVCVSRDSRDEVVIGSLYTPATCRGA